MKAIIAMRNWDILNYSSLRKAVADHVPLRSELEEGQLQRRL